MSFVSNIISFQPRIAQTPLRRPALLIRAARLGQSGWRRDRDLARLMKCDHAPAPHRALVRLRLDEDLLNAARIERKADYDMQKHVLLLIAILAEMRELARMAPQAVSAL